MARQKRSDDWGFPRWRSYGDKGRTAARMRLCDREGCSEIGDRPAPKAPNSRERWYFCEAHAAEYNKNWNYFANLSPEEAARRAAEEERGNAGYRQSAQWKWAGPGDGSRCLLTAFSSTAGSCAAIPSRRGAYSAATHGFG